MKLQSRTYRACGKIEVMKLQSRTYRACGKIEVMKLQSRTYTGLKFEGYCLKHTVHWKNYVHSCSKVMGFFLRWQNMVCIFKGQTWNFVCGIRRSFAFTMENILRVWYNATPRWTSKFGKVWKRRCQNAATRANIWRCFLVSWDDK